MTEHKLTDIDGIGPAIEKRLNECGIYTIDNLRENFNLCFGLEIPYKTISNIEKFLE